MCISIGALEFTQFCTLRSCSAVQQLLLPIECEKIKNKKWQDSMYFYYFVLTKWMQKHTMRSNSQILLSYENRMIDLLDLLMFNLTNSSYLFELLRLRILHSVNWICQIGVLFSVRTSNVIS